jgi:hypothetical protein
MMGHGISVRKYFVVVTHSPTAQLELESLLSTDQYHLFDFAHASIYMESLAPVSNASELRESVTQKVNTLAPLIRKPNLRLVLPSPDTAGQRPQVSLQSLTNSPANEPFCKVELPQPRPIEPAQETWWFDKDRRVLVKDNVKIILTGIESSLIRALLRTDERVVSKADLIRSIGREPDEYRGLEMCLSRFQDKFKSATQGQRLFRAVRNRGYCLTQKIAHES